jgi:hypothetical protein
MDKNGIMGKNHTNAVDSASFFSVSLAPEPTQTNTWKTEKEQINDILFINRATRGEERMWVGKMFCQQTHNE